MQSKPPALTYCGLPERLLFSLKIRKHAENDSSNQTQPRPPSLFTFHEKAKKTNCSKAQHISNKQMFSLAGWQTCHVPATIDSYWILYPFPLDLRPDPLKGLQSLLLFRYLLLDRTMIWGCRPAAVWFGYITAALMSSIITDIQIRSYFQICWEKKPKTSAWDYKKDNGNDALMITITTDNQN